MSIAIIDAREWQQQFDLRTGIKADASGPLTDKVKRIIGTHYYPGDMDPASNRWVSDMALKVIETYAPQFVFLTYARQYFVDRFGSLTQSERRAMIADVFAETEYFARQSGCETMIVGRGGMMPLAGEIDLTKLNGLATLSHWSARYAGLHGPSAADLELLAADKHVARIVSRAEFLALFAGEDEQAGRVPDYLLVAKPGHAFRALGCTIRRSVMIPEAGEYIPVMGDILPGGEITAIKPAIMDALGRGRRVALIVLEGVGMDDFPAEAVPCRNGKGWFHYEPGDAQYLTITGGTHRVFDYPPGYRFYAEDSGHKEYPLSGYFNRIPAGTIGVDFPGRSIAVGNKSMFMHMVAGTDICVECFARNLYNQGTLAVVHREDKA
ncbi:hypothetical protein [Geobacter sp. AOG2]|uniref:hypothetical protein n=1 Tax=Geobacter sp. AOG2 TaxID=1566347 RepID=UPI001CC732F5|nr:hypothetical protein [Geobacter sp. AOG2]GFE60677.1 hypothetical protein AOG2_12650 [Geobacter sp. AOG2]